MTGLLALWLRRRIADNANPTVVIASYITPVLLLIVLPAGMIGVTFPLASAW